MEEKIINKIRKIKKQIKKLYKNEISIIDFTGECIADSYSLNTLQILSKIDEELTDIIYNLLDTKNTK